MSQIGYKHGFNSKENFTRAFKSEHHILPSDYRVVDSSLKLLHKSRPNQEELELEPDTIGLKIEGGLYAVFDTPKADKYTFVNTIHKTWDYIYRIWIPQSPYINVGDCWIYGKEENVHGGIGNCRQEIQNAGMEISADEKGMRELLRKFFFHKFL